MIKSTREVLVCVFVCVCVIECDKEHQRSPSVCVSLSAIKCTREVLVCVCVCVIECDKVQHLHTTTKKNK